MDKNLVIYPDFCHTSYELVEQAQKNVERRIRMANLKGSHLTVLESRIDLATLVKVRYPDNYWHYRELDINAGGLNLALAQMKATVRDVYEGEVDDIPERGYALHMRVE